MNIKSFKLRSSWKIFWVLIAIAVGSLFLSFPRGKADPQTISKITPTAESSVIDTPAPTEELAVSTKPKAATKGSVKITTPAPTNSSTTNSNSSSGSTSQNSELQVSVSITSAGSFSLTVPSGSNHCDILSKALANGKISSLNMRFDNGLGSYGIYQINGLGKDNAVWWVYAVNGQSPGQGCSFIKVNNGDRVEWNYIGS